MFAPFPETCSLGITRRGQRAGLEDRECQGTGVREKPPGKEGVGEGEGPAISEGGYPL